MPLATYKQKNRCYSAARGASRVGETEGIFIVVASLAYSAVLHPPDDTISPSHTPVSITTAETNDTDDMFSKTETDFD